MRSSFRLPSTLLTLWLCACGGIVEDPEESSGDVELGPSKSRWSFELPDEGTPNDNASIGPFCCTGVSAVVTSDDGRELGYAYFFSWEGQAFNTGDTSFAPDFSILLSAVPDLQADPPPLEEYDMGEISFSADELASGLVRSADVGALHFTATIEHVDVEESSQGPTFEMPTLAVRLDVDPVE